MICQKLGSVGPVQQKIKLPSPYEKLHNEIVYLKEIFQHNRYCNDFVDLCIRNFFDKLYITKKIYQIVEKKQLLIILPFLGHLYFETRSRLNSLIRNQLRSFSSRTAFQSKTHLSILFKFKDSIPKYLHSHLYEFSCSCCNATYYGETERHLFVRVLEHLGSTPLLQKRNEVSESLPL